jgi:hypothetical protein
VGADQLRQAPAWLVGDMAPEQIGLRMGVALAAIPALAMAALVGRWARSA